MARLTTTPAVGVLCITAAVSACGPNTLYPGLMVTPSAFRESVRTIAVAPLVSDSVDVPERVAHRFEAVLQEELERLGLETVSADDYARLWNRITDSMAVFDADGVARDSAELDNARLVFAARLEKEWGVDAIAHMGIWEVMARFTQGVADWDGTSQAVSDAAARIGAAIAGAFSGYRNDPLAGGNIRAISLGVVIESVSGARLYENAGGLQVRQRIAVRQGGWYDVPAEELFDDRGRNDMAVTLALRFLRERLAP